MRSSTTLFQATFEQLHEVQSPVPLTGSLLQPIPGFLGQYS